MAFRAPLLGYNTNVRHAGKLYHIQTEDSGVDHPHIITHLFADGGRIVASKKTSYAERVGTEGLQDAVKKLMQAQHKAMFIALRDGIYDEDSSDDTDELTGPRKLPKELQQAIAAEARASSEPASEPALPLDESATTTDPAPAMPKRSSATAALGARAEEPRASASAVFKAPKADLPSESAALEVEVAELHVAREQAADTAVTKAPSPPRSLFGSDLLSDKSLDEVILNYLAANEKDG